MAVNVKERRVEVEWMDARSVYEELSFRAAVECAQLTRRFTLGYLVHKDKERLLVCGTFDPAERKLDTDYTPDEDSGDDYTVIPVGWVIAIRPLSLTPSKTDAPSGNES